MEVMEAKERLSKETKGKAKEKDQAWDEVQSVLNKEEVEEVDFLQPYLHLLSPSLIELVRPAQNTAPPATTAPATTTAPPSNHRPRNHCGAAPDKPPPSRLSALPAWLNSMAHHIARQLVESYNIERQAAAYYTRSVFGKFQKHVTASTDFIINQDIDYQGHGAMFELKAISYENPKPYSVHVVMDEGLFECSCHYFEMNGLICVHIIRAMVHLNVQVIPRQYLLERWSEAATTSMGRTDRLLDFGHPSTNTLKYNSLRRRLRWLASNACCNDDAYRILDDAIKALEPTIAAAKRGAMPDQQDPQQSEPPTPPTAATVPLNGDMPQHQSSDMLQNPARVPKKGRPTDREKRKKTLVEQRDDEQKKKMKNQEKKATTSGKTTAPKRSVRCKHYNELGHNIQTCGTLKAAMEAATTPQKMPILLCGWTCSSRMSILDSCDCK
ncbi:Protein FAR1-RELATED SEQUENCE 5 [Hordeum vulgare]|nr:Protein FAR1-RELATED SEQUENCE 5 [Hordeum vulgare]